MQFGQGNVLYPEARNVWYSADLELITSLGGEAVLYPEAGNVWYGADLELSSLGEGLYCIGTLSTFQTGSSANILNKIAFREKRNYN